MRYRKLDSNGDYSLGQGLSNFFINSPSAVAQAIQTTLLLFQGEWFLDTTAGVPWFNQIVGFTPKPTYDLLIKDAIRKVQGVKSIISYSSFLDNTRNLTINVRVDTIYGAVSLGVVKTVQAGYGMGGFGEGGYGE
jgi:hypothetical protein